MKKLSTSGSTCYRILNGEKVLMEKTNAACYSEFFRYDKKYTSIQLFNLDCEQTFKYKEFFLQYVLDMFDLEGSFNHEFFEFKTTGVHFKDLVVMTVVRFLWEYVGYAFPERNEFLFDQLLNGKCKYRNKLKRFCYFHSQIPFKGHQVNGYYPTGHSWDVRHTKIKSTADFKNCKALSSVNGFFTK